MRGDLNFCARCAAPLDLVHEAGHALLRCSNRQCRRITYRNAKPCAGVLVERDGRVLLVQRAIEPFKDAWDIPGGFLQEWEHPSECARREVHEETGLEVELTALLGMFVDTYGDVGYNTLNIYFRGRVLGGVQQPADDAAALGWFAPDELPAAIAFPAHEQHVLDVWRAALRREPNPAPAPHLASFVSTHARATAHADE